MIYLPNESRCSELNVTPKNWKSPQASIKRNWFISYRFYDPTQLKRWPKGKLIIIKGMNCFKKLGERRDATKGLLESELSLLKEKGYNPITNSLVTPRRDDYEISPNMPFLEALEAARIRMAGETTTLNDVKFILNGFKETATLLRLNLIPIGEISRRHILQVLDYRTKKNLMGPERFNKYKSYLSMLFNELIQVETIEENPMRGILKQKTVKKMRMVLNNDERKKINEFLKKNQYSFWRFMQIFFHSGARITELFKVKKEDVDLLNQRFLVTIKKKKQASQIWKPIKNIAVPFWTEIMSLAMENQYLFSDGLIPQNFSISPRQITRRWKTHVKDKLKINADFYSLKHLNLDEIADELSMKDSAKMASHISTKTTKDYYTFNEDRRQSERLKNANNHFA